MRHCCVVGCAAPAVFEIEACRQGEKGCEPAGPDPYSDQTDACEKHVGELLCHQPDAEKPADIYWRVFSISDARKD